MVAMFKQNGYSSFSGPTNSQLKSEKGTLQKHFWTVKTLHSIICSESHSFIFVFGERFTELLKRSHSRNTYSGDTRDRCYGRDYGFNWELWIRLLSLFKSVKSVFRITLNKLKYKLQSIETKKIMV